MPNTNNIERVLRPNDKTPILAKQYGLTPRWFPLAHHPTQQAFLHSRKRFIIVVKGRRAGGTEIGKRKLLLRALLGSKYHDPRFFCGAPTHQQATRIFWKDLKAMVPRKWIRHISESEKSITLVTGAEIWVTGLDKPERIEGTSWDGCIVTEVANVRREGWEENIRPALMDRSGWAILESAPEGRNHFYELNRSAEQEMREYGNQSAWEAFHWRSESVLPLYGQAQEVIEARRHMDPLTYEQELGAAFINFQGRAYYAFQQNLHCASLTYDPNKPLIFGFDFNVEPGVAVVMQEQRLPPPAGQMGTAVIGEVYIKRNSNTELVCDKLYEKYRDHQGTIICDGDATGGARHTSQTTGTDWDLIRKKLLDYFGNRVSIRVPSTNPPVRDRVNAVNSRLMSVDGGIQMMVNPDMAPHVVLDLEGVTRDASGDIDKSKHKDDGLTHISDAIGYYVHRRFPVRASTADSLDVDTLLAA